VQQVQTGNAFWVDDFVVVGDYVEEQFAVDATVEGTGGQVVTIRS
jgi:hypothetical protein